MSQTALSNQQYATMMHDSLMEQIDPRLCTENLSETKQYLESCTKRQAKKFLKQMAKSYKEVFALWEDFGIAMRGEYKQMEVKAIQFLLDKESEELENILDSISDLDT